MEVVGRRVLLAVSTAVHSGCTVCDSMLMQPESGSAAAVHHDVIPLCTMMLITSNSLWNMHSYKRQHMTAVFSDCLHQPAEGSTVVAVISLKPLGGYIE